MKELVNQITDELGKYDVIQSYYALWYELRSEGLKTYTEQIESNPGSSKNRTDSIVCGICRCIPRTVRRDGEDSAQDIADMAAIPNIWDGKKLWRKDWHCQHYRKNYRIQCGDFFY